MGLIRICQEYICDPDTLESSTSTASKTARQRRPKPDLRAIASKVSTLVFKKKVKISRLGRAEAISPPTSE